MRAIIVGSVDEAVKVTLCILRCATSIVVILNIVLHRMWFGGVFTLYTALSSMPTICLMILCHKAFGPSLTRESS